MAETLRPLCRPACTLLLTAVLLGACQSGRAATPTSSPSPSPELTTQPAPSPTPDWTPTPGPLTEATEPIVLEPPFPTPTASLAPPPLHLPDAAITLFRPGPGSQVRSPIRVIGRAGPSFDERVRVRLFGEDGRTLADRTTILFAYPGNAGRFVSVLDFSSELVAELGLLQVDTYERRYGHLAHRYSQAVVLLSTGTERVRPGHQGPAQLTLTSHADGAVVPMGSVELSGGGWATEAGPIVVQAYDRGGNVVASTPVELDTDELGRAGLFSATLDVHMSASQYGRLAVAELAAPGGEPRYLNSIEVFFQR